jgi:AraC-like DNA-binding protein
MVNLRTMYMPVQPTVKQAAEQVTYQEILPADALTDYIYCYWRLKTSMVLDSPFHYRVVADGCIDIFFELTNPVENFVMGFCKKYTEFPLDTQFDYVGIRFFPSIFPQLFNVNASELSNRFEQLALVVPNTAQFIADRFSDKLSLAQIKNTFDEYFLNLVGNTLFDEDKRFYNAMEMILKNYGVINIETDLDTGLSSRQLRRLFQFYVGDSAKTFSKVVRFQNILRAKPSGQSLKQNKLFCDTGYYDQAHFIKEFKTLYGITPGKLAGR